jgi:hypothetical protein
MTGTIPGNTYAYSIATTPTTQARKTLCLIVNLKSLPSSSEVSPVAAQATGNAGERDHLAHHARGGVHRGGQHGINADLGGRDHCRFPNNAFAEVSLPVRKTPNQPRMALKNGKIDPVAARARPSVDVMPE